ncbi:MAG: hypothetical protein IRZ21_03105 [Thermoleophilaceae bacterium]|nr:hypothetical protein [Thermoleophilaceae bacterium]
MARRRGQTWKQRMNRPDLTPAARRRQLRRYRQQLLRGPLRHERTVTEKALAAKPRKADPPMIWPGVGQFSKDKDVLSQTEIVRIAKQCDLLADLRLRTDYDFGGGRPREQGEWILAFLAFMQSGIVDIQPWWRESSPLMWWEAGFSKRPSYETTRNRFIELEQCAQEELFQASALLIREAIKRTGGRVCFDLHIDCTEAETHARMHHDCRRGEGCPGWGKPRVDRHGRRIRSKNGQAMTPARISTEEAAADRKRRNAEPLADDFGTPSIGEAERLVYDEGTGTLRMRVGQHWWRVMDPTAGPRAYKGPKGAIKFWLGFYNLKVVCHTFQEPVLNLVEAADEQELTLLPEVVDRMTEICGDGHIRALSADKGFLTKSNCQLLVEKGITAVMPFRSYKGEDGRPRDYERFDRDGIRAASSAAVRPSSCASARTTASRGSGSPVSAPRPTASSSPRTAASSRGSRPSTARSIPATCSRSGETPPLTKRSSRRRRRSSAPTISPARATRTAARTPRPARSGSAVTGSSCAPTARSSSTGSRSSGARAGSTAAPPATTNSPTSSTPPSTSSS